MSYRQSLHELRDYCLHQARHVLDTAQRERRNLTGIEQGQYEKLDAQVDRLSVQIGQERERELMAQKRARFTAEGGSEWLKMIEPGTPAYHRLSDEYRFDFHQYLAGGGWSKLSLQVADDARGGYLAPPQFADKLIKFLDDRCWMRELATVVGPFPNAVGIGIPSWDVDWDDGGWTAEVPLIDLTEDAAARFGKREFKPHQNCKFIKASRKLLRSGMFGLENLLVERLGRKHLVAEEKAFLAGDGAQKPLGIFVASNDGIPTSRDITASSPTAVTGDDFVNCLFNLKGQYHENANWVCHRDLIKMARKLKDGNGQYIWQPGLAGSPDLLLGRPYKMSEFAPNTFTAGQYVAVVGDLKVGYWIGDSIDVEVQRLDELLTKTNQTGFIGRKETEGAPVVAEAFSRLKLGS